MTIDFGPVSSRLLLAQTVYATLAGPAYVQQPTAARVAILPGRGQSASGFTEARQPFERRRNFVRSFLATLLQPLLRRGVPLFLLRGG
jgi:hypothetical protein